MVNKNDLNNKFNQTAKLINFLNKKENIVFATKAQIKVKVKSLIFEVLSRTGWLFS